MSYGVYGLLILGFLVGLSGMGLSALLQRDLEEIYAAQDCPNILYRY